MTSKPTGMSDTVQEPFAPEAAPPPRVKLTAVGNSVGLIIPKDILARMHLEKGDALSVVETPDGLLLKPYDANFEFQMEKARSIMKRYRNALAELAK